MVSFRSILSGLILPLVLVACASSPEFGMQSGDDGQLTFEYRDDHARQVDLVGSFNGWKLGATPLANDGDGRWTVRLRLPKGVCQYMFVIDKKTWIADPEAAHEVPDGFGRTNSVIIVE